MTWLSWRLQRTETIVALGILALLAALLVPTGINMWDAYHHSGLGACLGANPSFSCGNRIGDFRAQFQSLSDLANWFTLVPGVIGVLLAAPFVADLENGTYRLAWTQSVTRGRWLLARLGLPFLAALLVGGGLALLFNWWRGPTAHLDGRLDTGIYDSTGTVMIGYTLFALGLAIALGALWRRSAASLVVGFVGYFATRIGVDYKLRAHLVSPLTATWKGAQEPSFLNDARIISLRATVHGHEVLSGGGGFIGGTAKVGVPGLKNAVFHAVYQPNSHYWPLQLTETALFAGVALLLIAFAAWRVLRTD